MRLIDIEAPCKIEIELDGEKCHAIVTAPTVDAVPVKHGEWTVIDGCVSCSVCGEPCMEFNYCPNCGAKMDGWKENDKQ